MTHLAEKSEDVEQRRDDLLRRALATPSITNEEIVRRSKASHKRIGRKAGRKPD